LLHPVLRLTVRTASSTQRIWSSSRCTTLTFATCQRSTGRHHVRTAITVDIISSQAARVLHHQCSQGSSPSSPSSALPLRHWVPTASSRDDVARPLTRAWRGARRDRDDIAGMRTTPMGWHAREASLTVHRWPRRIDGFVNLASTASSISSPSWFADSTNVTRVSSLYSLHHGHHESASGACSLVGLRSETERTEMQ